MSVRRRQGLRAGLSGTWLLKANEWDLVRLPAATRACPGSARARAGAGARRLRLSTLTPPAAPPMVVVMRTMLDALVVAAAALAAFWTFVP